MSIVSGSNDNPENNPSITPSIDLPSAPNERLSLNVHPSKEATLQHISEEREIESEHSSEDRLEKLVAREITRIEALYGFLEENHPINQYTNDVLQKISGQVGTKGNYTVRVLRDTAEANAFAFPDGSIVVTPRILNYLESEDELAALLAHEVTHTASGHTKQTFEQLQRKNFDIKRYVGLGRLHELEADIGGIVKYLDATGYQPLAGASLFDNLQKKLKGESWSLEHGSLEDRRLNILSLQYVLDLEGMERLQTPIDDEIKETIRNTVLESRNRPSVDSIVANLKELHDQDINALASSLREAPSAREWMLAQICLKHWRQETNTRVAGILSHQPDNIPLAQRQNYPLLSMSTRATEGRIVAPYQQASRKIADAIDARLTDHIPDDADRAVALLSILQSGFNIPLLDSITIKEVTKPAIQYVDIPLTNGEFLAGRVNQSLPEKRTLGIRQSFDPTLWRELGINFLFDENAFEAALIKLLNYADDVGTSFVDVESWEFSPEILLSELELLIPQVQEFYQEMTGSPFDEKHFTINIVQSFFNKHGINLEELGTELTSQPQHQQILDWLYVSQQEPAKLNDLQAVELKELLIETYRRFHTSNPIVREIAVLHEVRKKLMDLCKQDPIQFINNVTTTLKDFSQEDADFTHTIVVEYIAGDDAFGEGVDADRLWMEYGVIASRAIADNMHWDAFYHFVEPSIIGPNSGEERESYNFLQTVTSERYNGDPRWFQRTKDWTRLFRLVYKALDGTESAENCWGILQRWNTLFSFDFNIAYLGLEASLEVDDADQVVLAGQRIIDKLGPQCDEPEKILWLSGLFLDSDLKRRARRYAGAQLMQIDDYDVVRDVIFRAKAGNVPEYSHLIEHLMEDLAQTPTQLEDLQTNFLEEFTASSESKVGVLSGLDGFFEYCFHRSDDFLKASLESRESDEKLIYFCFEEWWKKVDKLGLVELDGTAVTYFDKPEQVTGWVQDRPSTKSKLNEENPTLYNNIDFLVERLYRSDLIERHGLIRKMLTSQKSGVLNNKNKTKEIVNALLDHHVDIPTEQRDSTKSIFENLIDVATKDELYFLSASLLSRAILQKPTLAADRKKIVQSVVEDLYGESIRYPGGDERSGDEILSRDLDEAATPEFHTIGEALVEKAYRWAFTDITELEMATTTSSAEMRFIHTLPQEYLQNVELKKLAGVEALIEVATTLGAPGVRFLQLLGQYVPLDTETEAAFTTVYDNIKGQSKLSAYNTIKREHPTLIDPNDRISSRLGGGSLVTVYKLQKEGHPDSVVKVLNPNAEYRVKQSMDLIHRLINSLIEKDPANSRYVLIRDHLLTDLQEWLLADINDQHFNQLDPTFRQKWDEFTDEGHHYSMSVPKSDPQSSKFVKLEEFVDGKNLTQWAVGEETNYEQGTLSQNDMRDVAALISKNYFAQIMDGVVHSDVHPGNFRITPDNKIAILDRSYYLELDESDKTLFIRIATDNPVSVVIDYLLEKPENSQHIQDRDTIVNDLQASLSEGSLFEPEQVFKLVAHVKELGLKIPLTITLLLKNINGLNKLSSAAGFTNIAEAISYRPSRN